MTYTEALNYINNIAQFGDKPGLERVSELLRLFENPHHGLKIVHVAGTNGKGSVCAMLESVLRAAGYKTGLYISPYVEDYRERIQVNREMISEGDLARLLDEARGAIENGRLIFADGRAGHPRKFEIETACALKHFAEQRCDIVVLEVGLGGRLDATNVIPPPEVAVITSISLDHMQILGDTIEKITAEKRGIIKPGSSVVETSALPPSTDESLSLSGSTFRYKDEDYAIGLLGRHQIINAATAIEAAEALRQRGWDIPDEALREGLREARWNGRLEIVNRQPSTVNCPLCLIDGAHNQHAVETLCGVLDTLLSGREIITVMAMGEEKPYHICAPMLYRRSKHFIATEFPFRSVKAAELAKAAKAQSPSTVNSPLSTVNCRDAVRKALSLATPESVVLACGSLYMIGEAKRVMLEP
jgi:dihydrofolate synthase/folylpolyglutamate synthase